MRRTVEYEVSLPMMRLSVDIEDSDFEGMDDESIEYAIGEFIQDHFEQNISWSAKNRTEIVAEIIAAKEPKTCLISQY